jgi:hypothetical protein
VFVPVYTCIRVYVLWGLEDGGRLGRRIPVPLPRCIIVDLLNPRRPGILPGLGHCGAEKA